MAQGDFRAIILNRRDETQRAKEPRLRQQAQWLRLVPMAGTAESERPQRHLARAHLNVLKTPDVKQRPDPFETSIEVVARPEYDLADSTGH